VIDKVPSSDAGARMRATYVKLCLSVLASPLLFAAEVAYVTFPPELNATADKLSKSQLIRPCDLHVKADCKAAPQIRVWGPLDRESAISLLRAIGQRAGGFANVVSDGKVAKFDWSTIGGGHTEFWRLQNGSWSHIWTESVPY
jgi:hypothetical protein